MQNSAYFLSIRAVVVLGIFAVVFSNGEPVVGQTANGENTESRQSGVAESRRFAGGPFAEIIPPVSIKSLTINRTGDDPWPVVEVTNTSDRSISRLSLRLLLLDEKGSVQDTSPSSNDRWFGLEQRNELRSKKRFTISLPDHHLKSSITSVSGLARSVTWKDATEWPTWKGPAPKQVGKTPVSISLRGIVTNGAYAAPLLEFFNHTDKGIDRIEFQIQYLEESGKVIRKGQRTRIRAVNGSQGFAYIGGHGTPRNTAKVNVALNFVTFKDGSRWDSGD